MKVFETQLPGVGRRYQVTFPNDSTLTVLVSNDGNRQVFWRSNPDEDSEELFDTTATNARKLAEIFDGTYFEPVTDEIVEALSEAPIHWVVVPRTAAVAGRTIGEIGVRSRTGVTILAIRRDSGTISEVTPETEILSGDTLVVVGDEDDHDAFEELLARD